MWRTVQFFVRKGKKQAAKSNPNNIRQPSPSRNNITGPEHLKKNMGGGDRLENEKEIIQGDNTT